MPANLLNKAAEKVLTEAIHSELYASHLYRHIANQMQRAGYFGAQKWFAHESADELEHYQRIADFMNDMGAVAELPALQAITEKLTALGDAIQLAYDTELQLMEDYRIWFGKVDPVVQQFLLQFIEIQRHSVGEYGDWLARLARAGGDECAILIIDKELGE